MSVFVLALDGTPYTFLERVTAEGRMPNLAALLRESAFTQMDSVLPPVSSVAWASFMTGQDPFGHGIMGFVERDPGTMDWFMPSAKHLTAKTLLQILSERGRRVFSMNVPMTYPPPSVNGIVISGFLAPDLDRATYPAHLGKILKAKGYRIDADVALAKRDLGAFIHTLGEIMAKRFEIIFHFLEKGSWDLFMAHIMETDRLHHFAWKYMEEGDPVFAAMFYSFYEQVDRYIGRLLELLPRDTDLIILSDHGFTTLKREVQVNRFLREKGYLKFRTATPESLHDMLPDSLAYSLYPGRIYINLKGREAQGRIDPGIGYERLRGELKDLFAAMRDPETGEPVVERAVTPEEWIGDSVLKDDTVQRLRRISPDLFVIARDGFDLKGNLWHHGVFQNTEHNGVHTFNDAFFAIRNHALTGGRFSIHDVVPVIYRLLDEPVPPGVSRARILDSGVAQDAENL